MSLQWVESPAGRAFLDAAESLAVLQNISRDAVLQQFADAAASALHRAGTGPGLTPAELDVLSRSGGLPRSAVREAEARVQQGGWTAAVVRTALLDAATSLSTEQAASALGLTPSAVRHRVRKRTLWSFTVGGEHRFPRWQFVPQDDEGRELVPLPGLPALLRAVPADASASEINAVMTAPQPALEIAGEPVPIARWVTAGEDVDEAVEVLRGMTTAW